MSVNVADSSDGQISPEQFQAIVEAEFNKPRPIWSKKAAARLLQLFNPRVSVNQWVGCFENPSNVEKVFSTLDVAWSLGRVLRCLAELKKENPENIGILSRISWLWDSKASTAFSEGGENKSFEEFLHQQIQVVLKQDVKIQNAFWPSFAKGFARKIEPSAKDIKALKVYLFLTFKWEEAQKCTSIRQLFELVFQTIPKEVCPPDVDPIDFEDRQIKWFEQLCQRSLGLSLAKRGRPKMGKIKTLNA